MLDNTIYSAIDNAGLKRAQFINNCYKYWSRDMDERCTLLHMDMAVNIQLQYTELEEFSIDTIKQMIANSSEEYIVPEAKTFLNI